MKKMFCVLLAVLMLYALAACGGKNNKDTKSPANDPTQGTSAPQAQPTEKEPQTTATEPAQSAAAVDVDLSLLSSTMVYSEVYNMMYAPQHYIGKTVKMKGQFAYFEDPDTKIQYFACIIADATACCSQGLDFLLSDEYTFPDDYPEPGSEITVTGTFELYEENGFQYCRLADAALVK